jgi:hypothetical protein
VSCRAGEWARLPPARHARVDEARIARQQGLGAEPQALHHARPEPLHQGVGAIDEGEHLAHGSRVLQIDRGARPSTREDMPRIGIRPARPVDPEDVGAHVGKHHGGERDGADPGELHDPQTGERPCGRLAHCCCVCIRALPFGPSTADINECRSRPNVTGKPHLHRRGSLKRELRARKRREIKAVAARNS